MKKSRQTQSSQTNPLQTNNQRRWVVLSALNHHLLISLNIPDHHSQSYPPLVSICRAKRSAPPKRSRKMPHLWRVFVFCGLAPVCRLLRGRSAPQFSHSLLSARRRRLQRGWRRFASNHHQHLNCVRLYLVGFTRLRTTGFLARTTALSCAGSALAPTQSCFSCRVHL